MSIYDVSINALDGRPADLHDYEDKAVLVVNVASNCGLTPQYAGLEQLHERFADRGFTVLGVPCNQFGGQEPGTADEIAAFCSTSYGVTFPLMEKVDVNGDDRHPLYRELVDVPDPDGHTGDIRWNFEKFVVAPGGAVVARFNPMVDPTDDQVVDAIEGALPG
ncbi:MAG TPA: glutathione peroxidase [Acidimicrobiales bacterium]